MLSVPKHTTFFQSSIVTITILLAIIFTLSYLQHLPVISWCKYFLWEKFLKNGGVNVSRLAQLGAFTSLQILYKYILKPLKFGFVTTEKRLNYLKQKYGSWAIIVCDFSNHYNNNKNNNNRFEFHQSLSLVIAYARFLISKEMNILFIDISLMDHDDHDNNDSEYNLNTKHEQSQNINTNALDSIVQMLRDEITDNQFDYDMNHGIEIDTIRFSDSIIQPSSESTTTSKENEVDKFCASLETKFGSILIKGGIGLLINCCSPNIAPKSSTKSRPTHYNSSSKKITHRSHSNSENSLNSNSTNSLQQVQGHLNSRQLSEHSSYTRTTCFLRVLDSTLRQMLFRRAGGIISISPTTDCYDNGGFFAINKSFSTLLSSSSMITDAARVAEGALLSQLMRSMYYEYKNYGIDCLAVSLPLECMDDGISHDNYVLRKRSYVSDLLNFLPRLSLPNERSIVKASLSMLGKDAEVDTSYCRFVNSFDFLLQRNDGKQ